MTTEIAAYLAKQPADRRAALSAVRDAINAKLAPGYEEAMQYGMISWRVPESVLPAREVYNKQPLAIASLGSMKNYMVLHMMGLYGDAKERAWFDKAYKASGKKLDMGKGCLRFTSLDNLAVDVVAEAMSRISVERYVAGYRAARATRATAKPAKAKKPAKTKKPRAKRA